MKTLRITSLLLLLAFNIRPALGCFASPEEQITPANELVERSKTIVLAKVVKAELIDDYHLTVRYYFQTIRGLKGDPEKEFFIDGGSLAYRGSLTTFDHHHDEKFWDNEGGRSWHDTDCIIYPTFTVGGIFLIFLDEPFHRKSFEMIVRTHGDEEVRDKWLTWVENQISREKDEPNKSGE